MPESITLIKVVVASPSNVREERDRLGAVVNELNRSIAAHHGCRLELLRWKYNVRPGLGRPQSVVNDRIGDTYDVFIGIMWSRFGTPTDVATSGTEEEFERAHTRHTNGERIDLMFYFCQRPIPRDSNPAQLRAVQEFEKGLGQSESRHPTNPLMSSSERDMNT